jgi:hypothetical protein
MSLPAIRVDSVRKVFDDGAHNAFTDLCVFRGEMYLTFRSSPTGHGVVADSSIIVLASRDGAAWRKVHSFSVPMRDVRDPHLLVFKDALYVYTGTWLCNPWELKRQDVSQHLGWAARTADGTTWEPPRSLEGTYGHYIWRAAAHGGKAYLCGRRIRDFVPTDGPDPVPRESVMLESDDGFVWKWSALFHGIDGDETAFLFEPDGAVVAVVRRRKEAALCRARPPYREWTRSSLGRYIGGPMIAKWGERTLIGGRKFLAPDQADRSARTVLSWLDGDRLVDVVELPSGGDTSYPGFIALSPTRGLLSYYSSHEGSRGKVPPCSIYLAELSVA